MATAVFLCSPGHGHVNPTLAVARELVAHGEQVIYYLPEPFRTAIEDTGASFRAYQPPFRQESSASSDGSSSTETTFDFLTTLLAMSRALLPQTLEWLRADQASYIVYDSFCLSRNGTWPLVG